MIFNRRTLFASAFALTLGLAACTGTQEAPEAEAPAAGGDEQAAVDETLSAELSGAGASFPAPLYQQWFSAFNEQYPGVQISYQSVGSGAGIEQYLAGTVDFGATDAPLSEEEREQFASQYGAGPIQVPMTGGAVVFAYNLPGAEEGLQLSREAYCGIVGGDITSWDDPAIAEVNEGVDLPSTPIQFVHRSDGSGTTFIFTNHIAEACPNWEAGAGRALEWPTGTGARGNEGITAQVQQTEGAIGYVEYAYANENGLSMATLENEAGEFIEPTPESAALAFEGEEIPEDFALTVPNPTNPEAYPIAGLTWLLIYPEYDDPATAEALNAVVEWALTEGDQYATELGYIPLGGEVQERVITRVEEAIGGNEVAANPQ
ncbi:MAG: phosphate ABC transporter substrate-binding protein PstS [Leptolyngbyaceae cyanobacterium SL_5_9]|nr:phosphate ABC transporter substrate-binding protein PstS [Leptolyngbyaceae cyanobacterium SL_5_9]NJO74548.1 phosphate ABC transporter substrate-binding protein PstS [Leptolyngbyaceae cyanobacterium RM1_406_9]